MIIYGTAVIYYKWYVDRLFYVSQNYTIPNYEWERGTVSIFLFNIFVQSDHIDVYLPINTKQHKNEYD